MIPEQQIDHIASGVTLETPRPVYINDALKDHPAIKQVVYRYDGRGRRYYCVVNKSNISWYVSVTALIESQRPKSPYLVNWQAKLGDDYIPTLNRLSSYGTWMHSMWNHALITGDLNLDEEYINAAMTRHISRDDAHVDTSRWIDRMQEDLLALGAWVLEYHPVVLAIEPVMTHPDGYAGAIDLVCRILITEKGYYGEVHKSGPNKGKPKESTRQRIVTAIVDYKSGRKGFYENHEIQLHAYRNIWNNQFAGTEYEVEKLYNLSPKGWRTTPKFSFADQTDRESHALLSRILETYKVDPQCYMTPPPVNRIAGSVRLGEPIDGLIETLDPATIIRERINGGTAS